MSEALKGQRVVVTRARHQADELAAAFTEAGAVVELLPLLEVVPPADPGPLEHAAATAGSYDWVVFTSANAVEALVPRLPETLPETVAVAAVGKATAAAARRLGVEEVHVVATRSDAEGLVAELAPHLLGDERVLVPRADDAREALVEGLAALGCTVTAVSAYGKRLPADAAARARALFDGREIGWVTFTSPRTVRHFVELFGDAWERRRGELAAASIGAVTSRELRRHGVDRIAEASEPSPAAMVRAVVASA